MKRLTTEEFIEKSIKVHGNKYDYSKVKYINNHTNIEIICPTHGSFYITPNNHLSGKACKLCKKEISHQNKIKYSNDEYIEKCKMVHGDKYDYSKTIYDGYFKKHIVICPIHGEFEIIPANFLKGHGCALCSKNKKKTTQQFIIEAKQVHGNKYDYSKVEYVNNSTKICIICPKHGEFWQIPNDHLCGKGCRLCRNEKFHINRKKCKEQFIIDAKQVHGNKYDYSKVDYKNNKTKVCIICPKHGEFWQTPHNHLLSKNPQGCPYCKQSHLESKIRNLLIKEKIQFIQQFKYDNNNLRKTVDFYLPFHNVIIECQGGQHFFAVDFGNKGDEWANDLFMHNIQNDLDKHITCKKKNINILYYTNKEYKDKGLKINELLNFPLYNENNLLDDDKKILKKIIFFLHKNDKL